MKNVIILISNTGAVSNSPTPRQFDYFTEVARREFSTPGEDVEASMEKEKTKRMKSQIRRGKNRAYSVPPVLVAIVSVVICALLLLIYIQHKRTDVNAGAKGNVSASVTGDIDAETVTVKQIRQNIHEYDKHSVRLTVTVVGMAGRNKPEYLVAADSYKEYMRLFRSPDIDITQQAANEIVHLIPCRLDIKHKSVVSIVGKYNAAANTIQMSECTVVGMDN